MHDHENAMSSKRFKKLTFIIINRFLKNVFGVANTFWLLGEFTSTESVNNEEECMYNWPVLLAWFRVKRDVKCSERRTHKMVRILFHIPSADT